LPDDGLRIDAVSEGATAPLLPEALNIPDPSGNADIPTFGFTYKNGGLVVRNQTVLSALVSRELIDLAVYGFNPELINEYAARNTALRSFTLTTVTFGMRKRFDFDPRFAAGFAVRYVRGRKLLTGKIFEPAIDVGNVLLSASAATVEVRGGNGMGLAVGMTYEVRPDCTRASRSISCGNACTGARISLSRSRRSGDHQSIRGRRIRTGQRHTQGIRRCLEPV